MEADGQGFRLAAGEGELDPHRWGLSARSAILARSKVAADAIPKMDLGSVKAVAQRSKKLLINNFNLYFL
jgi:hypothetical protein